MKKVIVLALFFISFSAFSESDPCARSLQRIIDLKVNKKNLYLSKTILNNNNLNFETHSGNGMWDTAVAMNIEYGPILKLRREIAEYLDLGSLDFFKAWNPAGEAHVTTITPVEWWKTLRPVINEQGRAVRRGITIDEIHDIVRKNGVQSSDLEMLGIGYGTVKNSDGSVKIEAGETFFVIVNSLNLLRIRREIYKRFLELNPEVSTDFWDPDHFFPHITIGYTVGDIHESQGLIKNVEHSLDKRFRLLMQ